MPTFGLVLFVQPGRSRDRNLQDDVRLPTKVIDATQGGLEEEFYNSVAADGDTASNGNWIAERRAA